MRYHYLCHRLHHHAFLTERRYPFDTANLSTKMIISIGVIEFMFGGLVPDYIALWKTRLLLRRHLGTLFLVSLDVIMSVFIAIWSYIICVIFYGIIIYNFYNPLSLAFPPLLSILEGITIDPLLWVISPKPKNYSHLTPLFLSTFVTSIWTVLLLLSTAALKLLAPVHRFSAWFFDVEHHPVQAIGIVAGTLVMIGSLAWPLVVLMI